MKYLQSFRQEVQRLARRETSQGTARLTEEVRRLKKRIAGLEKEYHAFKQREALERARAKAVRAVSAVGASKRDSRLSPNLIKKLRQRLKLSRREFGQLIGVSQASVVLWENGSTEPRPELRGKIIGLRKLSRRDIARLLKSGANSVAAPVPVPRKTRKSRKA